MRLKKLELTGFKSFAKKTDFLFEAPITAIVGPNGSGKSNATEAFRWVLGERSLKSLRGGRGEDLIWNGGHAGARQSRAAVTLTFDNSDRFFSNLDYEEVALTREVFRDGTNNYSINNTVVKYREYLELLSAAALGSADHFIINQGEADRVLVASPLERRTLIEDALGLRLYQWKINESEKKLLETKTNLERVASLRREIAPHLKFLKKQIEKIEQADKLRQELKSLYLEYLKREETYLSDEERKLKNADRGPKAELAELESKIKTEIGDQAGRTEEKWRQELLELEKKSRELAGKRDELTRRLGRLEGMIAVHEEGSGKQTEETERVFSETEVKNWLAQVSDQIDEASRLTDVFSIKSALNKLKNLVSNLWTQGNNNLDKDNLNKNEDKSDKIVTWRREQAKLNEELAEINKLEGQNSERKLEINKKISELLESERLAERENFELKTRRNELWAERNLLNSRFEKLKLETEDFKREISEGKVLVDQEIDWYKDFVITGLEIEPRAQQSERRRRLERLKIKLEDLSVESGDTLKEYQEVSERDTFLAREITDLETATVSLDNVMTELREKIDREFADGVAKINKQFQELFELMFGGGVASLSLAKLPKPAEREAELSLESEKTDQKSGLEINVSLPRKKVRHLEMLSGGERALVSIALLFALSQVNPPPFLVLDETDAALDEANSRRYGEMIEKLSRQSQLVLVTHNRETMSRAGVIYGVTMAADGVSRLLSIKFDEAAAFAK